MRFLLDQSTDARILQFLRVRGHDATRIASDYPAGLRDQAVLTLAHTVAFHSRLALDEARALFTQCVALARSLADGGRTADSLLYLGQVAYRDGDYVRAAALSEESAALFRACGDAERQAEALSWLGTARCEMGDVARGLRHLQDAVPLARSRFRHGHTLGLLAAALARHRGVYRQAEALVQEGLEIYRTIGAPTSVAANHTRLARLALYQGDYERAQSLLDESLRVARAAGAPHEVDVALAVQGDLLLSRGLYDRAEAVYGERLQVCRSKQTRAETLLSLGTLAHRQGRLAQARERLESALTLVQGTWLSLQSLILAALGRVAAEEGDLDEAGRLLGESLGLERAMGRSRETAEALEGLAAVAVAQGRPERAARASLGAGAVDAIWTGAQTASWEQIVDEVLSGRHAAHPASVARMGPRARRALLRPGAPARHAPLGARAAGERPHVPKSHVT
jgi:tetratricopeptide (TPR) repeat protein